MTKNRTWEIRDSFDSAERLLEKYEDVEITFGEMRADETTGLIAALIKRGFRTKDQIVERVLDLAKYMSAVELIDVLDEHTGDNPALHLWFRHSTGTYHLLH